MTLSGNSKAILLWGIICLLGYGVYQFWLMDPVFPKPLILWIPLTIIGLVGMVLWVPAWKKNKVVQVWFVIAGVGMLYHLLFANQIVPAVISNAWQYWALLSAIGFAATGYVWPTNKNFWYGVGALHAVLFLLMVFAPSILGFYNSAALAIASGATLIYAGGILKFK